MMANERKGDESANVGNDQSDNESGVRLPVASFPPPSSLASFLHFNDVYNIEKSPRFVAALKSFRRTLLSTSASSSDGGDGTRRHRPPPVFTVFSGDAFSPSMMSTVMRGEQMVPILNSVGIDVACLGNHDLDFGLETFRELREQTNFPWLCSNARDALTGEPLGGCEEYVVLEGERRMETASGNEVDGGGGRGGGGHGFDVSGSGEDDRHYGSISKARVLCIGLVESGWLDTLSSVDPEDVIFEEPSDFAMRRIPELRKELQLGPLDIVLAVTHMRMPKDFLLASKCGGGEEGGGGMIDLILGGHDHHYEDVVRNGVRVINSGCDFKSFTVVDVLGRSLSTAASLGVLETKSRRVTITSDMPEDEEIAGIVHGFQKEVDNKMDIVVGRTKVPLDARFSEIRTKETNISNFIAELMTRGTGSDVAILNAGSIRADRILDKGNLTARDLCDLLPMMDETEVVELTGRRLILALENGVSRFPAMEGRFPCVDGVRFAFDPSCPAGSRVVLGSVYVKDRSLKRRRNTVLMRGGAGIDGGVDVNGGEEPSTDLPENKDPEEEKEEKNDGKRNDLAVAEDEMAASKERNSDCGGNNDVPKGFVPIDLDGTYSVCSKAYLISGKDGYDDAFAGAPILRDSEDCPVLPTLMRNVFTELRTLRIWSGLTSDQGAVLKAASTLKGLVNRSIVDPFAISPIVDGRIRNVAEGRGRGRGATD